MPWFPDFIAAAELARRQARHSHDRDPVTEYLRALTDGDTHELEADWPGHISVFDPYRGEVHTHRALQRLATRTQEWLADRLVSTETIASTTVDGRAVVELTAQLTLDGDAVLWPLAVVGESADDLSVVIRTYCSQWPLLGRRPVRGPVLDPAGAALTDVVASYERALAAGDTDAIVATFAPDGYLREPIGTHLVHRGHDELRSFFTDQFRAGGIEVQDCRVTDDGVRCALEYNVVRWGDREAAPQAALAVFERGPDGLLAGVRTYDDVEDR